MNRIQIKDSMKSKKNSLSCFDDKIYIQNSGYNGLTLELIKKNSYFNYLKKLFCQAYCFNFQPNQQSFFVKDIKFKKSK